MELTVLGSGTSIPTLARGSPGYALEVGRELALLDCGSGTLHRLAEAGLDFWRVTRVFLSHFHPDHMADLVPLLFGRRNPVLEGKCTPLVVHGPRGLRELLAKLHAIHGDWLWRTGDEPVIEEVDESGATLGGALVTAHAVDHTDASVAFRFEAQGKVLAYSGDSDPCDGLVAAVRDADLAVLECSFPDGKKIGKHLTPSECAAVAARARAKRILLSHLYPIMETIDPVAICERALARHLRERGEGDRQQAPIFLARDLMRLGV
jgi:ribonuclease BN (tRNA processing enzyme)